MTDLIVGPMVIREACQLTVDFLAQLVPELFLQRSSAFVFPPKLSCEIMDSIPWGKNMKNLRVYLDVCCLNRPFDDQKFEVIKIEAEAVIAIFRRISKGEWKWVISEFVHHEISQTPDEERKKRLLSLARKATEDIETHETIRTRAHELEKLGIKPMDALHLSSAETGCADVFLTTDKKLCKSLAD
jgi:predicted nucleic acid-binding protein